MGYLGVRDDGDPEGLVGPRDGEGPPQEHHQR